MTLWLRGIVQSAAVAAVMLSVASNASFAVEPGDFTNYLRGASQGLALGALPPPGIYGGFALDVTGAGASPGKGNQSTAFASNPAPGFGQSLLFVPGWTIFGGSYAAQIVQGMYYGLSTSSVNPPFAASAMNGPELANTTFNPFTLSWTLGHGWFTALGINIIAPIGSQWHSTLTDLNLNPDYWTFAPAWALSYIDPNWFLSANFRYDINTASRGVTMGAPILPGGAPTALSPATNCSVISPASIGSASGNSVPSAFLKRRPRPTGPAAACPARRRSAATNRKSGSVRSSVTTSALSRCKPGSTTPSSARMRSAASTYGAA